MSGISSLQQNTANQASAVVKPYTGVSETQLRPASEIGQKYRLPFASDYALSKIPKQSLAKMENYKPRTPAVPTMAETIKTAARTAAAQQDKQSAGSVAQAAEGQKPEVYTGCKTCQERTYKDGSDDPGVSFQTAKSVPSATAAISVASHEGEHVTRETDKAQKEDRVVTNKRVTLQFACCPECKQMYVAGGVTTIQTMAEGLGGLVDKGSALDMDPSGENVDENS